MEANDDRTGAFKSLGIQAALAVGTVLVIIAIIAALVGPAQVWCGVQDILGLMPESDPIEQEEVPPVEDQSETVRVDLENGYIEVTGYQVMTASTCLTIRLEQVPAFRLFPGLEYDSDSGEMIKQLDDRLKQIYLVDQEGQEYRYQGGNFAAEHLYISGCAKEITWSSNLMLEIPLLSEQAEILTLVVPLSEDTALRKEIPRTLLVEAGDCRLNSGTITW